MKKRLAILGAAALVLSLLAGGAAVATHGKTGNGAPNGPHYNLNIIGTNDKTADMDGANGRVIFVKLEGNSKLTALP